MTTVTSSRRKQEDWEELADKILPDLQENGGMTPALRKKYGIGYVYRLQVELGKKGFDLHGQPLNVKPIKAKRPDVVAKAIAQRRSKGAPYWLLAVESGMTHGQMERLVREHGYSFKDGTAESNGS